MMKDMSVFKNVQAFLFDVDGTLTTTHQQITEETKSALVQLSSQFPVGLCTGRSFAELYYDIIPLLPPENWHIVSGGAQVVNGRGETLWEKVIPDARVREIVVRIEELNGDFGFSHQRLYTGSPKVLAYKAGQSFRVDTVTPDQLDDWSTSLLVASYVSPEVSEYVQTLTDLEVKSMVNFKGQPYFDITPPGITKREGAKIWSEHMSVSIENIAAFGDSLNDLEVLEYVGVGVALGNARQEVKAIADYEIAHTDDNGVAKCINELLQLQNFQQN